MRTIYLFPLAFAVILLLVQCSSDSITITPFDLATNTGGTSTSGTQGSIINVSTDITADITWTTGNTYILDSLITVSNGATLTIESCVLVKAENGATGLVIDKGANIDAQGTESCPIIFTSVDDALVNGDIVSPNLTAEDVGLWAGVFILGDAPVSTYSSPSTLELLPGLPTYGGTNPTDDSGILSYVSIRHTGYETRPDEATCGLVLAGVGSGTTIDHVELFSNSDDGLVVQGGTVNITHLITSAFQDDGIDCDKGYGGTMDNLIGIGGNARNSSLELDGGEGASNPSFTLTNASFQGSQNSEYYIDFQQRVNCVISDAYFFGFDSVSTVILARDEDADNWLNDAIDVVNLEFNTSHLVAGNTTIGDIFVDKGANANDAFSTKAPDARIVTAPTVGADKSRFLRWTVADLIGALDDF